MPGKEHCTVWLHHWGDVYKGSYANLKFWKPLNAPIRAWIFCM